MDAGIISKHHTLCKLGRSLRSQISAGNNWYTQREQQARDLNLAVPSGGIYGSMGNANTCYALQQVRHSQLRTMSLTPTSQGVAKAKASYSLTGVNNLALHQITIQVGFACSIGYITVSMLQKT